MERLTDKKEADAQRLEYENRLKNGYPRNIPEERFLKLAAYEDAMPIERAQELAQAEKDGRLVVLPSDDYTWQIRGDLFLNIIRANCRAAREEAEAALKKREEADNEAD